MHALRWVSTLVVVFATSCCLAQDAPQNGNPLETRVASGDLELNFNLTSGSYANYVLRSNETAAQVLVGANRFLVALPAGNSGAVAYWNSLSQETSNSTLNATSASPLNVTLGGPLRVALGPDGLHGVSGTLLFSQSAQLGATQIGSVRQVRDFTEGGGLSHEIFNYTVTQLDANVVWFSRRWLNETVVRSAVDGSVTNVRYGMEWRLQAGDNTSFEVTPGNNGTFTPPTVVVRAPSGNIGSVNFTVQVNETALIGVPAAQLFNVDALSPALTGTNSTAELDSSAAPSDSNSSASAAPSETELLNQMSFLTYSTKFTAGGWRFLTYFGRDSLITVRLLLSNKLLSSSAAEAAFGAVLDRINTTSGQICHEETVGDYATFVNAGNNQSYLGNTPYYDYKMKDTHYLLLPQFADWLLLYNVSASTNDPSGTISSTLASTSSSPTATSSLTTSSAASALPSSATTPSTPAELGAVFLSKPSELQNGTLYRTLLARNVEYVLNTTSAFATNPTNASGLARIQEGVPVGNWRDSNLGLADGVYPFDVNVALVPAALHAIADLANATVISDTDGYFNASRINATDGTEASSLADRARAMARVWEQEAPRYFEVPLSTEDAEAKVEAYVGRANLTDSLLYGYGSLNDSASDARYAPQQAALNTSSDTINSSDSTTSANSTLYALSLAEDYSPIPVLHSDLCFPLLLSRVLPRTLAEAAISALRPYPRGLLTNIGMLVANPATSPNETLTTLLDRTAYHGTVVWGWQDAFMAAGLARVRLSCANASTPQDSILLHNLERPEWCQDTELVGRLSDAERLLWASINGAYEERFAEVWSWKLSTSNATEVVGANSTSNSTSGSSRFEVVPLGELAPEGTEADALQLWSFGLLGLQDPTGIDNSTSL